MPKMHLVCDWCEKFKSNGGGKLVRSVQTSKNSIWIYKIQ